MHILLVDDHALFREGLTLVLQQLAEQTRVWEAGDVDEALRQLELMPSVELMLVDINLPGPDGLELIGEARARGVQCPVAVISASDEGHLIRRALAAGAQTFIPKATDSATLLSGLGKILAGETWLPKGLAGRLQGTSDMPVMLNRRQQAILQGLAEGASNTEIGECLHISTHTVKFHLSTLYRLFDAKNRTECVMRAREAGLLKSSTTQDKP